MKKLAVTFLVLSLIGIFLLLLAFLYPAPKQITGNVILNEKEYTKTTGKITSVKEVYEFKIIKLDNNLTVVCYDCPKLKKNQKITAIGTITNYSNTLQINAEMIKVLE